VTARIVVLGSADAFSSSGRGNTAWLLEDGIAPCTVDFGPTALVALKRLGRDPQRIAGREAAAFAAQHHRGDRIALMLSLSSPAGRLAFTGDTGPCDALHDLARGADLLCAECTEFEASKAARRRHLAWSELRSLLPALGVRRVLLGHLGEEVRANAPTIEAEARGLGLDLRVCDDLAEIALFPGHPPTPPL